MRLLYSDEVEFLEDAAALAREIAARSGGHELVAYDAQALFDALLVFLDTTVEVEAVIERQASAA